VSELPQGDSVPDSVPTYAPPEPPQRTSAKWMAVFSLWSPFIGFFSAPAFRAMQAPMKPGILADMVGGPIVACLVWATGLVLGFIAIQRTRILGRRGIFTRAVIGVSLDAVLICTVTVITVRAVAIYFSVVNQRASQRITQGTPAPNLSQELAEALKEFESRRDDLLRAYFVALAGVTNQPPLDMSSVKSKSDLEARKERVHKCIEASAALGKWNMVEAYSECLSNRNISPQIRDATISKFAKNIEPMQSALIASCDATERELNAILAALGFLEVNWGAWHYQPATRKIIFQKGLLDPYNRCMAEVNKARAEAVRLAHEAQARAAEVQASSSAKP